MLKNLKMSYIAQGKKSANCGPCSIKIIADYYNISHPKGPKYSVQSLNRLLNVSSKWGCEISDINRVIKRLGLKKKRINWDDIAHHLSNKRPIITVFMDEENGGHYAVLKGETKDDYIFHDPYFGRNF